MMYDTCMIKFNSKLFIFYLFSFFFFLLQETRSYKLLCALKITLTTIKSLLTRFILMCITQKFNKKNNNILFLSSCAHSFTFFDCFFMLEQDSTHHQLARARLNFVIIHRYKLSSMTHAYTLLMMNREGYIHWAYQEQRNMFVHECIKFEYKQKSEWMINK